MGWITQQKTTTLPQRPSLRWQRAGLFLLVLVLGAASLHAGTLNVSAAYRYSGLNGLGVVLNDGVVTYVETDTPDGETRYRVRFYIKPGGVSDAESFDLFAALATGDVEQIVGTLSGSGGDATLVFTITTDTGSVQTPVYNLPAGWRAVEFDWMASTGANDGYFDVWIDGVAQTGLSGLDNDMSVVDYARWGGVANVGGVNAVVSADDYASNRTSYIGMKSAFNDISLAHVFRNFIHAIYAVGITSGCSSTDYCPDSTATRAQMAIFLLRGIYGLGYAPPPPSGGVFNDIAGNFAEAWIEELFAHGITAGCGSNNYCPNSSVTRGQMAIFLLRSKYGSGYLPPPASGGVFTDIAGHFAEDWIEQLFAEGITSGCGPSTYCPDSPVTRGEMAVFIVRTFGLSIPQL